MGLDVDAHSPQCIDEADRIRACILDRPGDLSDIGHIGTQLDHDGHGRMLFRFSGDLRRHRRHHAILQSTGLDVGTGDVDLDHIDSRRAQLGAHDAILLRGISGNIGDNTHIMLFELRQFAGNKSIYAGILKADGVQDAHRCLCNSGRRIALPTMQGQTLDADAAQLVDGIKLAVLPTKAERAGGHDHRVFHRHAGQRNGHIHFISHPTSPPRR